MIRAALAQERVKESRGVEEGGVAGDPVDFSDLVVGPVPLAGEVLQSAGEAVEAVQVEPQVVGIR
jgi:hypothetical protein